MAEAYLCRISVDSSRAVVRYNCVRYISIGLVLLHFAAELGGSYKIIPLMCEFYWLFADIFSTPSSHINITKLNPIVMKGRFHDTCTLELGVLSHCTRRMLFRIPNGRPHRPSSEAEGRSGRLEHPFICLC